MRQKLFTLASKTVARGHTLRAVEAHLKTQDPTFASETAAPGAWVVPHKRKMGKQRSAACLTLTVSAKQLKDRLAVQGTPSKKFR
jgi:hypothetical protein